MTSFEVIAPGLLTTVQDLGRPGSGPSGVSPSGAADAISLRIGNRLVGNAEGAAALEMTLLGGSFLFHDAAVVALAGSDFGATLDGAPAGLWTSLKVGAGATLRLGATRSGARCYLCVAGGVRVPEFLGSSSTHILSGTGGFKGRALRKGDVLATGGQRLPLLTKQGAAQALGVLSPRKILRVTEGPQSKLFSGEARRAFAGGAYRLTEACDRMGLRLEGGAVKTRREVSMISEGVSLGAVQITAAGLPIILFVDQQTAGGYPKIANVISADMHCVGQLRPRDEIRFEFVTFATARKLFLEQEKLMASAELLEE